MVYLLSSINYGESSPNISQWILLFKLYEVYGSITYHRPQTNTKIQRRANSFTKLYLNMQLKSFVMLHAT